MHPSACDPISSTNAGGRALDRLTGPPASASRLSLPYLQMQNLRRAENTVLPRQVRS
jgi:hypothetical protein